MYSTRSFMFRPELKNEIGSVVQQSVTWYGDCWEKNFVLCNKVYIEKVRLSRETCVCMNLKMVATPSIPASIALVALLLCTTAHGYPSYVGCDLIGTQTGTNVMTKTTTTMGSAPLTVTNLVAANSGSTFSAGSDTITLTFTNVGSQGFVHVSAGTIQGGNANGCTNTMNRWTSAPTTLVWTAPSDISSLSSVTVSVGTTANGNKARLDRQQLTLTNPSASPNSAASNTKALGSQVTASVALSSDKTTATFTVTYNGDGWVGLGVGTSMTNTDMVICSGNPLAVKRYWSTGRTTPSSGSVVAGATCSLSGGKTTMTFTRNVAASGSQENPLSVVEGAETDFIWAYKTSTTLSYHTAKGAGIKWVMNPPGSSPSPSVYDISATSNTKALGSQVTASVALGVLGVMLI